MILYALMFVAVALTCTMFATKQAMLGFPSALFWAILGAYSYTVSTVPWGDMYYYLAFASLMGMTTFCALGAVALREKRDSVGDESMEKGDGNFVDESSEKSSKINDMFSVDGNGNQSKRTQELKERAEKRRTGNYERR